MYGKHSNDNDQCPSGLHCSICHGVAVTDVELMGDNLHIAFELESDNPDWVVDLLDQLGAEAITVERVA